MTHFILFSAFFLNNPLIHYFFVSQKGHYANNKCMHINPSEIQQRTFQQLSSHQESCEPDTKMK